ncbi:MAG: hypothetical protein WCH44_01525 [Betaproteobacteria bacterium]
MKILTSLLILFVGLAAKSAMAWGDHRFPSYRAFERMPEVAQAGPVKVESLQAFLLAEAPAVEKTLAQQEVWAAAHLDYYPALPAALAFKSKPALDDEARKKAFLMALRVAPNYPFALYFQPDPRKPRPAGAPLAHASVNTLPLSAGVALSYFPLAPNQSIDVLSVVATASEEPDNGVDINLWADNPSEWGKLMGLGPQPFGNPSLPYSSQGPFHMGFYHESPLIYKAAGFVTHTFPLLRQHQFATLSILAFRTGHPYWGWRFAGMALHYLQDLTQPFHASLSPGDGVTKMIGINVLAMAGLPKWKDDLVILLSNRHLVLEHYQATMMRRNAILQEDTSVETSLRAMQNDGSYPEWNDNYVRDVVSAQAAAKGETLVQALLQSMPKAYVSDPQFDFGPKSNAVALNDEVARTASSESKLQIEAMIAQLLGNFGAHSRNALRGILRASRQP